MKYLSLSGAEMHFCLPHSLASVSASYNSLMSLSKIISQNCNPPNVCVEMSCICVRLELFLVRAVIVAKSCLWLWLAAVSNNVQKQVLPTFSDV